MEIERKWHMKSFPELPVKTHTRMEQSYLSIVPELRIRKYTDLMGEKPDKFELTIKSEGTLAREEINKELTREEYEILLNMNGNLPPVVKDHRTYDYNGYVLEFSVVDPGRSTAFSYAEVEFPTVEEAEAFKPPEWFGRETTNAKDFRMRKYWQATRLRDK